ncbi:CBS domain-containing protein [Alicyclobacillaceae bacterium I2511]|nr:CBS domain-containing protein [Alicyclobacillaceae bacterium I2511]
MKNMKATDIMIHSVITVRGSDTVETVLRKFVEYGIGGMPIINDGGRMMGYISDGDIMRAFAKNYQSLHVVETGMYVMTFFEAMDDDEIFAEEFREFCQHRVLDVGVRRVISVKGDDPIDVIARVLSERKIKKVPVVHDGNLIGIISRGDVIRKVVYRYLGGI